MILISYDFDYRAIKYLDEGLNSYPNGRFSDFDKPVFPTDSLKSIDFIDSTIALGGGLDSIVIVDSNTKSAFVIEPCSSLLFAFKINECLDFFKENSKGRKMVKGAGIVLFDNFFRIDGDRGIYELDVIVDFYYEEFWKISFRKNEASYVFSTSLDQFIKEYASFLRKTVAFYSYLIEGFCDTVLGEKLVELLSKYDIVLLPREGKEKEGETFYDRM
jgi:hypothetical protein